MADGAQRVRGAIKAGGKTGTYATPALLNEYTVPANCTVWVRAYFIGQSTTAAADIFGGMVSAVVNTVSTTCYLRNATAQADLELDPNGTEWVVALIVSGQKVQLQATGTAGDAEVIWASVLEVVQVEATVV